MSRREKEINFIPILIIIAAVLVAIGIGLTISERISSKKATPAYASAGYRTENEVQEVESKNNVVNDENSVNEISNNSVTKSNTVSENKAVSNNTVTTEIDSSNKNVTDATSVTTSTATSTDKNRKIDPKKPMVALTFDDGPNGTVTPKILNTLEKYGVVATFFVF